MRAEKIGVTLVIQVENTASDLFTRYRLSNVLILKAYVWDLNTALAHV